MSESTLIQKIKADAMATVADIKTAGVAKVDVIQRETKDMAAEKTKSHEAALEKKLAHLELVSLSKAKQARKIALQKAKRDQIDALFTAVHKELVELPASEYTAVFSSYVKKMLPYGVSIVSVNAPEKRLSETADILKEYGFSDDVTSDMKVVAGLVVVTSDGVYDITLKRIMTEKRAELEMKIMQQVDL